MQALNREPLYRCESSGLINCALEELLHADNRDDNRTPAQRRQKLARRPHFARRRFAFEID